MKRRNGAWSKHPGEEARYQQFRRLMATGIYKVSACCQLAHIAPKTVARFHKAAKANQIVTQ
jgi:hypothetical protein